jgi:hypothetical protein
LEQLQMLREQAARATQFTQQMFERQGLQSQQFRQEYLQRESWEQARRAARRAERERESDGFGQEMRRLREDRSTEKLVRAFSAGLGKAVEKLMEHVAEDSSAAVTEGGASPGFSPNAPLPRGVEVLHHGARPTRPAPAKAQTAAAARGPTNPLYPPSGHQPFGPWQRGQEPYGPWIQPAGPHQDFGTGGRRSPAPGGQGPWFGHIKAGAQLVDHGLSWFVRKVQDEYEGACWDVGTRPVSPLELASILQGARNLLRRDFRAVAEDQMVSPVEDALVKIVWNLGQAIRKAKDTFLYGPETHK